MNSNNQTDIPHQSSPAMRSRQMLFYVLEPHSNHRVSIVFIQLGIANSKRKRYLLLSRLKKFRKSVLFNLMDFLQRKPSRKSGKSKMRRRLDDCTRNRHTVLLQTQSRALRDEISWIDYNIRRYIVRMIRFTWKRVCPSLGTILYPPCVLLMLTTIGGRLGFFLNMQYYNLTTISKILFI